MAKKKQIREEEGFSGVTGSGTINYYPKWKTATELEDGFIYYDPVDFRDKFLNTCFFWLGIEVAGTTYCNDYLSLGLGNDLIICNLSVNKDMIFRIMDDTGVQKWKWMDDTGKTVFSVNTKGKLELLETGAAPQFYIGIQAGDLAGNYDLTLPTGLPAELLPLLCSNAGVMQFNYVSESMLYINNAPAEGYFLRWSAAAAPQGLFWGPIPNDYITEPMLVMNNAPVAGYTISWNVGGFMEWVQVGNVTGAGAAGQVSFWTGANAISGDNDLFWDNVNKRLGIGTISPLYTYEMVKESTQAILSVKTYSSILATDRSVFVMSRARGTVAIPAIVQNGDDIGSFQSNAWNGVGFQANCGIWFKCVGPVVPGNRPPGEIRLATSDGIATLTDRLIIDKDGLITIPGYYIAANNAQFAETCQPDTPNTLAIAAGNRHVQPVVVAQKMTLTKFMLSISIAGSGTAWVAVYDVNGSLITSNSFAPAGLVAPSPVVLSATLKPGTYYLMFVSNVACTLRGLNKIHANMRERSGTIGTGTPPPASFTPSSITNGQFIPWFHISEV